MWPFKKEKQQPEKEWKEEYIRIQLEDRYEVARDKRGEGLKKRTDEGDIIILPTVFKEVLQISWDEVKVMISDDITYRVRLMDDDRIERQWMYRARKLKPEDVLSLHQQNPELCRRLEERADIIERDWKARVKKLYELAKKIDYYTPQELVEHLQLQEELEKQRKEQE